jgi:hypothetical protein
LDLILSGRFRTLVLPLFAGGFLFFSGPLRASPWEVRADRVEIDGSRLRADGGVTLTAGDSKLDAMHLEMLLDLDVAHAWQNVTLEGAGLWASGEWIGVCKTRPAGDAPQFFDGLGGFLNVFPRLLPETGPLARALP